MSYSNIRMKIISSINKFPNPILELINSYLYQFCGTIDQYLCNDDIYYDKNVISKYRYKIKILPNGNIISFGTINSDGLILLSDIKIWNQKNMDCII